MTRPHEAGGIRDAAAEVEWLTAELRIAPPLQSRLDVSPDGVETGVSQWVLTPVGFVLERRRNANPGLALLMRIEEGLDVVRDVFGLEKEDLNIDRGPLGRLL